jgi:hypothetical protein
MMCATGRAHVPDVGPALYLPEPQSASSSFVAGKSSGGPFQMWQSGNVQLASIIIEAADKKTHT